MARVLGAAPAQGGSQGRVLGQAGKPTKSKGFSFDFKKGFKSIFDPKSFKQFLDPTIGAAKGVASTIGGAATLSEKGARVLLRKPLEPGQKTVGQKLQAKVQPKGAGQQIGFFAEQVGEFFVPGGAVAKGTRALSTGRLLQKAPKVARLVKPALQAVGAGTVGAVQTGDVQTGATIGAITAAAGPVFKGVGSVANRLSKFFGRLAIPSTPAQLGKDIARGVDVGGAVQRTGVSLTRKGLVGKIDKEIVKFGEQLGKSIDDVVKTGQGGVTKIGLVLKGLKEQVLDDPKLFKKIGSTPIDKPKIAKVIDQVVKDYKKLIGSKTILDQKDLQKLKVMLGDGLEKDFEKAVGATVRARPVTEMAVRSRLKTIIEKNVPEAGKLNKILAPLFVAKKRLAAKAPKGSFLIDIIAGGLAGGGLGQLTENPGKFFRNAVLGIAAERLARGTAAKTVSASALKSISNLANNTGFLQALRKLATEEQ